MQKVSLIIPVYNEAGLIKKLVEDNYKKVIENAIYKSQKIITPSNFVKEDILKNFERIIA